MVGNGSGDLWWGWWIEDGPLGAATWAGTALSALGIVVSIIGLALAVKAANAAKVEAKNAEISASAARDQASIVSVAISKFKGSLGISSLAYLHSQIGMLLQFVESGSHYPAHVLLSTINRELMLQSKSVDSSSGSMVDLRKRLKRVSTQIGYAQSGNEKFRMESLRNGIIGLQDMIVQWEGDLIRKGYSGDGNETVASKANRGHEEKEVGLGGDLK